MHLSPDYITRRRIEFYLLKFRDMPYDRVPWQVKAMKHLIDLLDGKEDRPDPVDAPWMDAITWQYCQKNGARCFMHPAWKAHWEQIMPAAGPAGTIPADRRLIKG